MLEPLLVQAASMTYDANYSRTRRLRELNVMLTAGRCTRGRRWPFATAVLVRVGLPHAQIFAAAVEVAAICSCSARRATQGASACSSDDFRARSPRTTLPVLAIGSGSQTLVQEARDGPRLRVSRIVAGIDFGT